MKSVLAACLFLLTLACGKSETPPAPPLATLPEPHTDFKVAASQPTPASQPATLPATPPHPLTARPGGPSIESCQKAADHLAELFTQATAPSGLTNEQMAYVNAVEHASRAQIVQFCVQTAAVKEIDCVVAATTVDGVGGCERFRREVPEDLVMHKEATEKDCARFFDRLRQFKLADGDDPAEIDKTRDQIIRACEEKAKPGTIACFIASPTYDHARLCP